MWKPFASLLIFNLKWKKKSSCCWSLDYTEREGLKLRHLLRTLLSSWVDRNNISQLLASQKRCALVWYRASKGLG